MLTGRGRRTRGRESGQMLTMALMLLVLLLGFSAIVVDVGFFLHRRERVQHIADAAALAGAQELPNDMILAEDIAREWAARNGLDGSSIDVSFECRATNPLHCEPSGADTIMVEGEMRSPLTLMPVLRLLGGASDNCWLNEGCDVAGTAAACRGECTTAVTPADIALILDRTGSMTNDCRDSKDNDGDGRIDSSDPNCGNGGLTEDGGPTDLEQAQAGARAMLEVLNPELQSVGLGVLPPSISQSFWQNRVCRVDTNEPWSPNDDWLVVNLSDDYKRPDGSLNSSSRLLRVLGCLQSEGWTNIGYPVRAARQHLEDPGYARDDAQKAIVLLSDGAANRPRNGNPCALAAQEADIAKAEGIEVYTIGYGTDDNTDAGFTCSEDNGPWRNQTAETLLRYMATDDDHFFQEPEGSDLTDVFEEIGRRLAAGSRLVE